MSDINPPQFALLFASIVNIICVWRLQIIILHLNKAIWEMSADLANIKLDIDFIDRQLKNEKK